MWVLLLTWLAYICLEGVIRLTRTVDFPGCILRPEPSILEFYHSLVGADYVNSFFNDRLLLVNQTSPPLGVYAKN